MNRSSRGALAALALAVGLTPASSAGAAVVAVDLPCYPERFPVTVGGQGFTPGGAIALSATGVAASATADATGVFSARTTSPSLPFTGPGTRTITLTATDGTNAALTAATTFRVTTFAAATTPRRPTKPGSHVRWSVSGFAPGRSVYAHYVFGGHQRARVRLGTAARPCGTLRSPRIRAIPVNHPSTGIWTIQLDRFKAYRARKTGVIRGQVRVFRTYASRAATAGDWALLGRR